MVALPESRPEDDEDVVWGLSTASALWARGERRDAIVWLRRAAEAAAGAGQEFRGSELGMYASELEDMLNTAGWLADGAPLPDADAAAPSVASGTGPASPEVIELLDVEADHPSQVSIDLEDEPTLEPGAASAPTGQITPPPGPVPPPFSVPPAAAQPAPRPVSVAPSQATQATHPSSPPRALSGAPPVAASMPAVVIPPPAPLGVAAPPTQAAEVTPSSSPLRANPTSSRRLTPEPRKSQPRSPILDPWDEETLESGAVVRPLVSFQQGAGGEELVLPRRSQPASRASDSDDDVFTSAAPLDASLTKKTEPRPPRKPAPKPSIPAEAGPTPGHLAQAAGAIPSKGLSAPPPPRAPSPSVPPPAASKPAVPSIAPTSAATTKLSLPPPAMPPRPSLTVPKPSVPPPPPPVAAAPRPASLPVAPGVPAAPKRSIPPPAPSVAAAPKPSAWPAAPAAPVIPGITPAAPVVPFAAPAAPVAAPAIAVAPVASATPVVALAEPPPSAPLSAPASRSAPPSASAIIEGVPLDEVDAFGDLPPDMQHRLVALARVEALAADEEVSSFGAALLLAGEASVCATIVDTPACRAVKGTLVPSRGSLVEPVGIRVVAGSQGAKVAIWDQPVIEDALKSCPWVLDELVSRADRIQALAGATMGALGDIDEVSRGELLDRLTVHFAQPGEALVEAGGETLGLAIVGGGVVELSEQGATAAKALHPGELLFARSVLEGLRAPRSAHAGASGALVLIGEGRIAQELMASSPPLASLLADAVE